MKLKRYNLYTFNKSKLIWTETENVKQAISNFNRRVNIDTNGYNHPELEYSFNPMRVISCEKPDTQFEGEDGEKILAFNCASLNNLILKDGQ